jgi:hypothetical protein
MLAKNVRTVIKSKVKRLVVLTAKSMAVSFVQVPAPAKRAKVNTHLKMGYAALIVRKANT